MVKPELGTKRVCVSCGARFYDLRRTPAACPKCGAEQPAEQPRTRRGGALPPEEKRQPKKPAPVEDNDLELEDAADADGETEDDDVLEENDLEDDDALDKDLAIDKD